MSNVIKFPSEKRVEDGATQAENPFLNSGLYESMQKHAAAEAIVVEELLAVQKRGAGCKGVDPITAPSLHVLRQTKKGGTSLAAVLTDAAAGVNLGSSDTLFRKFGLQTWDSEKNRATGGWNLRLALDLSTYSNADPIFTKAGVPNWRSLVAEDAAELQIETVDRSLITKAFAIFYIGDQRKPA